MTITVEHLTNNAYGFPGGQKRRVRPIVLLCAHITGNPNSTAQGERDYANRTTNGTDGRAVSAHDYLDRDGSGIEALSTQYAAWSNGDVMNPKTELDIVKAVLAFRARGYNANEAYVREVEDCGYPGTKPVTPEQLEQLAQFVAADSVEWGIPISRATVGQHSDLNTSTRPHCADLSEAQLAALITRAIQINTPEDPMLTKIKAEDFRPVNGSAPFRAAPDRSLAGTGTITGPVRTLGELDAGGENWRVTRIAGLVVYLLRSDLEPLVAGGDPATDQALTAFLAGQTAPTTTNVKVTVTGSDGKVANEWTTAVPVP